MLESLLSFVGEIYEASYNPGHWDKVVETLCCEILCAKSGAIFVEDRQAQTRSMIGAYGLPAAVKASYRFGMAKYDHTFQLQSRMPVGQASQITDAEAVRNDHPFYYRLILKPNDIGFISAINVYNDDEWHVGIGLHRSFNATPFSEQDCRTLTLLYPHFNRALRIHREFHRLKTRQQSLHEALSRFMIGLVIVDASGKVTYLNPVAETLMAQHGGLSLSNGMPKAYYADEDHRLQTIIKRLLKSDRKDTQTRTEALGVHHPDRELNMNIMMAALGHEEGPQPGSLALYLSDPDSSLNLPASALQSLYDMTPKEANVAIALVNGQSPTQISQLHGVSVDTVRSQLKSIYSKMGVKKQQDVIRVLLSTGALA
ncbi:MAG: helix-turn-helix transcriptional regulator [Pseudomonadales bacterium]|uniref:helix-turn-helix transcriptional regulator n=1 Tax=Alcanivorax sp. MD8A TaxID=1177157 RepID=UPI000C9A620C|nr:helix-turn-helix transcriptional regulator [Alcanivorax sp. MD8A]MCG8437902.1 helix-turn-helix transcriptional regulator [Pseudomonadales bacterium]MEE2869959.1 helix-turn-helix transcriptional regulator [Pseudomonadota bacterium]PNE01662.1 LuxR family transcriptional regulator [Alcanivorax sp. MD8A]